jgi:2,3,4,5-tetrahydropyridine-2,6-dicarboxylate N-succinyltransferase
MTVHIIPSHESPLRTIIEDLWERRADISPDTIDRAELGVIRQVIGDLDHGTIRVADKDKASGQWVTHQ